MFAAIIGKLSLVRPEPWPQVTVKLEQIELSVYPNPAQDVLYVSHKAGANALLQLIDMNGKVVFNSRSANANNERMKINVSGLSAGTYVVRIESEGKTSWAKFVKK